MAEKKSSVLVSNKQISAFYNISERIEAGIVLTGPETKSCKASQVNLKGAYVSIHNGEAYLKNAHINPYKNAIDAQTYTPIHDRKLLLHKQEIEKLDKYINQKGTSIQPLNLHLAGRLIKVELAVCTSKKLHDRRADLKHKAQTLEINRTLRKYN